MRILIFDLMQGSNATGSLTSPALADTLDRRITSAGPLAVNLGGEYDYDAVGVGNTDATQIVINGTSINLSTATPLGLRNGLYDIAPARTRNLRISHNGSYIGRLAIGMGRYLGCSPSREPGFWTSNRPRITVSGQVIPAAGGIGGRQIGLQIKYKFTREVFSDIQKAWSTISRGYPFFVSFDAPERARMPWNRMYALINNDKGALFLFQSSVKEFLYSKDLTLKEAF